MKKKGHKNQGKKHHERGEEKKNGNKPQILQTGIDVAKEKRTFSDPWEGVKP